MTQQLLPLPDSPTQARRGRGRPKGATGKRSADLGRYIEAVYGGLTPGQQMAAVCLVTPKDIREAKKRAVELGITDLGLQPLVLAMVVKADQLATALGIGRAEAWSALHVERRELMNYIHQKRAPKADEKADDKLAHVFMVPDGADAPALADFSQQDDETLEFLGVPETT